MNVRKHERKLEPVVMVFLPAKRTLCDITVKKMNLCFQGNSKATEKISEGQRREGEEGNQSGSGGGGERRGE